MTDYESSPLCTTEWLAERLGDPGIILIDATWYMPGTPEDPRRQFEDSHIPGAVFMDIDAVSDQQSALPHMLPSAEDFTAFAQNIGVNSDSHVVVYDRLGIFSAPRVWWTFRAMGHNKVSVLDGGLKKWLLENRTTESGSEKNRSTGNFTANQQKHLISDNADVLSAVQKGIPDLQVQVVDARPAARFLGEAEEPRPGLQKGCMPGALNIPFNVLISADGTMKTSEELKAIFLETGVASDKSTITTCGSGITASVIAFALFVSDFGEASVYDGSWAEWGQLENAPISVMANS